MRGEFERFGSRQTHHDSAVSHGLEHDADESRSRSTHGSDGVEMLRWAKPVRGGSSRKCEANLPRLRTFSSMKRHRPIGVNRAMRMSRWTGVFGLLGSRDDTTIMPSRICVETIVSVARAFKRRPEIASCSGQ